MGKESVLDQIARSLSFEIQAIPQEDILKEDASSSKTLPVNLKIKVRKKYQASIQDGVLTIPHTNRQVRLVSSDQTIMSFDVLMEHRNNVRAIKKPRKGIFGILGSGRCLGTQNDDDEYAYMPATVSADLPEGSPKGNSDVSLNVSHALSKNAHDAIEKRPKHFFGKCKPGGCLDPPFNEDRYSYRPAAVKVTRVPLQTLELKPVLVKDVKNIDKRSSLFDSKIFRRKVKSIDIDAGHIEKSEVEGKSDSHQLLSLFRTESIRSSISMSFSNSIITYPPGISSSRTHLDETKARRASTDKKTRKSVNEISEIFYTRPKQITGTLNRLTSKQIENDIKGSTNHIIKLSDEQMKIESLDDQNETILADFSNDNILQNFKANQRQTNNDGLLEEPKTLASTNMNIKDHNILASSSYFPNKLSESDIRTSQKNSIDNDCHSTWDDLENNIRAHSKSQMNKLFDVNLTEENRYTEALSSTILFPRFDGESGSVSEGINYVNSDLKQQLMVYKQNNIPKCVTQLVDPEENKPVKPDAVSGIGSLIELNIADRKITVGSQNADVLARSAETNILTDVELPICLNISERKNTDSQGANILSNLTEAYILSDVDIPKDLNIAKIKKTEDSLNADKLPKSADALITSDDLPLVNSADVPSKSAKANALSDVDLPIDFNIAEGNRTADSQDADILFKSADENTLSYVDLHKDLNITKRKGTAHFQNSDIHSKSAEAFIISDVDLPIVLNIPEMKKTVVDSQGADILSNSAAACIISDVHLPIVLNIRESKKTVVDSQGADIISNSAEAYILSDIDYPIYSNTPERKKTSDSQDADILSNSAEPYFSSEVDFPIHFNIAERKTTVDSQDADILSKTSKATILSVVDLPLDFHISDIKTTVNFQDTNLSSKSAEANAPSDRKNTIDSQNVLVSKSAKVNVSSSLDLQRRSTTDTQNADSGLGLVESNIISDVELPMHREICNKIKTIDSRIVDQGSESNEITIVSEDNLPMALKTADKNKMVAQTSRQEGTFSYNELSISKNDFFSNHLNNEQKSQTINKDNCDQVNGLNNLNELNNQNITENSVNLIETRKQDKKLTKINVVEDNINSYLLQRYQDYDAGAGLLEEPDITTESSVSHTEILDKENVSAVGVVNLPIDLYDRFSDSVHENKSSSVIRTDHSVNEHNKLANSRPITIDKNKKLNTSSDKNIKDLPTQINSKSREKDGQHLQLGDRAKLNELELDSSSVIPKRNDSSISAKSYESVPQYDINNDAIPQESEHKLRLSETASRNKSSSRTSDSLQTIELVHNKPKGYHKSSLGSSSIHTTQPINIDLIESIKSYSSHQSNCFKTNQPGTKESDDIHSATDIIMHSDQTKNINRLPKCNASKLELMEPLNKLKKGDDISINLAFQSYITENNERILKTFDIQNEPVHFPNAKFTIIQSHMRLSDNNITIPMDSDYNISIQINKAKPSIQHQQPSVILSGERTKVTPAECSKDLPKNILTSLYEENLVPLQNTIKNLKRELDVLATHKEILKNKIKRNMKSKNYRSLKKCGCVKTF